MPNKVFVVTDATSGIGKAVVAALARTGETVVMVARDASHGNAALQEITSNTPDSHIDMQLGDLSIISSVRNLAEILKSRYEKIDVLINHANRFKRKRAITVDGFEETFAANHLGPFLLTNLLLERLQAAVQVNGSARILNITAPSKAPLNFEDLQGETSFDPSKAFEAAKTANLLFTLELARRLENTGITVNAIHPGPLKGGLSLLRLFTGRASAPPERVIESIVQAAVAPESEKTTGRFLQEGQGVELPAYADDRAAQQRLWEISESLTQLTLTKGVTPINDPHLG